MIRRNNHTTILLASIVIILILGLCVTLYYVLDLDWFNKKDVDIYNEFNPNIEQPEVQIKNEIKYDITKRAYNLVINTDEFKIIVYKDGTVGVTMLENERYSQITDYNELLSEEKVLTLANIIRAYDVTIQKENEAKEYILLLDIDGNVYELIINNLNEKTEYEFSKVEGIENIIDIKQIILENTSNIDAIAIDNVSNEILLNEYLK